jgi:protein-S-isoprenylcysteine O-methyltransferase Ste14
VRKLTAVAGSAGFGVLAPGVVAGLVPWWLTRWRMGAVLTGAGAAALPGSFAQFAVEGQGTPAPPAPTGQLEVGGLYGYVRNPMYLAVLAVITGQGPVLVRPVLLGYAAEVAAAFTCFVYGYEQPALARRYGPQYLAYRQPVPAWWPSRSPFGRCDDQRRMTSSAPTVRAVVLLATAQITAGRRAVICRARVGDRPGYGTNVRVVGPYISACCINGLASHIARFQCLAPCDAASGSL